MKKNSSVFLKMPVILLLIISSIIILNSSIPIFIKQFLYSISLTIKSVIIFLLPFVIFSILLKAIKNLSGSATVIILVIITLSCVSNFIGLNISHFFASIIYDFNLSLIAPNNDNKLITLWDFTLPKIIKNDIAMFGAIVLGLINSKFNFNHINKISIVLDTIVQKLLKYFSYIIPLFISGFIIKMAHESTVQIIIHDYKKIFIITTAVNIIYILFIYLAANQFHIQKLFLSIKNMIPAAISAFSTMSSAATMPLTILGTKQNINNKEIVDVVIPATVNIHLVGDVLTIPIFTYAVMKGFAIPKPSFYLYLIFALYFIVALFSMATIPGGGIIVMLPVLESNFGFNADMMALITAIYILFDPLVTCINVLGNGAFAQIVDKLIKYTCKK